MQTTFTKAEETAPNFYVVSAKDVVLGQLAVRIAKVLQGKHKPSYTPNVDDGDYVIVTDAREVALTGGKDTQKVYRYHTGFVGGLKEVPFRNMREEHPEQVIALAVRRMLPKTRLARQMMRKLKVYGGSDHPHLAQNPKPLPNV